MTRKTKTSIALGAALVALLVPALVSVLGEAPAPTTAIPLAQATSAPARRARAARPLATRAGQRAAALPTTLRRAPGHELSYRVRLAATLVEEREGALSPLVALRGEGQVVSLCCRADARGLRVVERLTLPGFRCEGLEPAEAAALSADLERGVDLVLDLGPRGELRRLAIEGARGAATANLLRSWAGASRFVLPAAQTDEWEAAGYDAAGACRDAYRVTGVAIDGVSVQRRRSFLASEAARGEGGLEGVLRPSGALGHLGGREQVRVQGLGPALVYTAEHELAYLSERQLDAATLAVRTPRGEPAWDEAQSLTARGAEAALGLDEALALAARGAGEGLLPLRGVLRRDAAAAARVGALAADAAQPEDLRRTLIDALAAAETPSAQRALLELARTAPLSARLLPNVYLGLGQAPEPLPEVVAHLTAALDAQEAPRAEWATQAVGFLASNARSAELQEALAATLEGRLGGARDELVLSALGNAGLERSLSPVGAYLERADAAQRREAVFALRKLPSDEAGALIARALAADPSVDVRREAARALASRSPEESLGGLERALRADEDEGVRLEAVRTLKAWLAETEAELDPAVRGDLEQTLASAAGDASPAVREAALEPRS
ncbi:MAG: HEAT repeat domain-containing protein [Planctomycetota bacterium]